MEDSYKKGIAASEMMASKIDISECLAVSCVLGRKSLPRMIESILNVSGPRTIVLNEDTLWVRLPSA